MPPPEPSPISLAAIIVTHDRLAALKHCLSRVLAEPVEHVIVVDNASAADTALWLSCHPDPRLCHLRLPENLGGAGGFEAGLRHAMTETDAGWFALMDDDACPQYGAFSRLKARAGQRLPDGVGAIAAAVFRPDGTISEMNRPSHNPFRSLRLIVKTVVLGTRKGFHLPDSALDPAVAPRFIDVASFVGFFVNRIAVARAGLPDGAAFIYGDDVLYSLRLRRLGFGILFDPAIRFDHDCKTLGPGHVYRPLWKVYYLCRNGVAIARAAAGPVMFPAALLWYLVSWMRRARHYAPVERKIYYKMIWMGIRDAFLWRGGRRDDLMLQSTPSERTSLQEPAARLDVVPDR